ncbi:MAG: succinate dehydrogenase cytochrome b subunit [Candidatus Xiphinematobacter sp.]|nr:MAG: succinate dehydrogenase cytochrome b subunit [Candidatus Xiphinematobacter sp.]QQY08517.1 MAG: succinate dehydrogenase cytochrome b subunit [Candidatus Xiphinematobacter sp.]QQY09253.1 MAG: succinate dehydrogenase cytochrome b subunit [Candidatus Xiphinematobacter sp.]QQY10005.1 MAG: succinate dehydrogenase cytochrome b subunit [Candidatus Xiphinematobacter sp.]QQY10736.1 MAG: succinate dehydrogenase cytochrome b subunit [Candidatus Xiphinematobacter sp.]
MSSLPIRTTLQGNSQPLGSFAWTLSSVTRKIVVALTGIILLSFLFGHLLGNLTVYMGPGWTNSYGKHLRDFWPFLWMVRIVLLVAGFFHVYFAAVLWRRAAKATIKNVFRTHIQTKFFNRTVRLSGVSVFIFVLFHLCHFTWGLVQPAYAHLKTPEGERDIFSMVAHGFRNPFIAWLYVIGLFLLTLHLSHGVGSLFQTLGISNRKFQPIFCAAGHFVAWTLFAGYISIPLSILFFGLGGDCIR